MTIDEELADLEMIDNKMSLAPWKPCGASDTGNGKGCSCGLIWSIGDDVSIAVTHKPQDDEEIDSEVTELESISNEERF